MEKKKSIFVVFFFLYDGFQFSKINFWFTFRKNLVTKREKKGQMCISRNQSNFCLFSSLLLFILRIKTMSCMIFDQSQKHHIAVTLADSCDGPCNRCLLPRVSISDIVLGRKLSHQWLTLSAESSIVSINTSIHSTYSTVGHYISGK